MKGLVDLFTNEVPNIANLKALTVTEIPILMIYAREVYLTVSLLLSCGFSIYVKLVEDMGNRYFMGKDNYPQTLPKIQNIFSNW